MAVVSGARSTTYRVVSVEDLIGYPLNEFEKKYAPQTLYVVGTIPLPLRKPRVAVVGTRQPSSFASKLTEKIVRKLVSSGVVVVSGLARGIDTTAHLSTIQSGGKTIAVLGTPLTRFYPPENKNLQQLIMKEHLAVSQFPSGHRIKPRDFIMRNRTMALISDASVIVEAGETSGALSQGWEALRLRRPLFISEHLFSMNLTWPAKMVRYGAKILTDVDELLEILPNHEVEWKNLLFG